MQSGQADRLGRFPRRSAFRYQYARARETGYRAMIDPPESGTSEVPRERRLTVVPTPLRKRAIDLANLSDVRREMGRLYRDMRARRIDTQDGTRLVYVLVQIAKIIEQADMQPRLEAIERALANRPPCK